MKPRKSILDGGLFELSVIDAKADCMFTTSKPPTELPELGLERRSSARVATPAGTQLPPPPETVSLKLLASAGRQQDIATAVAGMGGSVTSMGKSVVVANVPRDRLSELEDVDGLLRAEQKRRLQMKMDVARGPVTRTDLAIGEHDLSGEGVVVGVIDSGIDWQHDDFRNDDDSSRLELFIHAEEDTATQNDAFSEFTGANITAAIAGTETVPQGDLNGHGTHCASIAAGNGRAAASNKYRGVAPKATLMGMRTDTLFDTHTIHGIRRIFEAAGDRPAVINLSLGGHIGPHDGTSALERVIAEESGPGRIVVVAAGNEAQHRIHDSGRLVMGQDLDIVFTTRDSLQYTDIWIPRGDAVDFTIIDPSGTETTPDGTVQATPSGPFRADIRIDPVNNDTNLLLAVAPQTMNRRWTIRMTPTTVTQGDVHAWGHTRDGNRARDLFMASTSTDYSLGMPATEETAIVVGSFVTREAIKAGGSAVPGVTKGALSPFSSFGPTRSGWQRPDVVAPGQHIIAALAGGSEFATAPGYAPRRLSGGKYISIQGTSMATPFVVGAIALMLEQQPNLSPWEIQQRLRATSQRDAQTGAVWNSGFGYGKIDVKALLDYGAMS